MYRYREILDDRYDPSVDDNEALSLTYKYGYADMVELLMTDDRVDASMENNFILIRAIKANNKAVASVLIKNEKVNNVITFGQQSSYDNLMNR